MCPIMLIILKCKGVLFHQEALPKIILVLDYLVRFWEVNQTKNFQHPPLILFGYQPWLVDLTMKYYSTKNSSPWGIEKNIFFIIQSLLCTRSLQGIGYHDSPQLLLAISNIYSFTLSPRNCTFFHLVCFISLK